MFSPSLAPLCRSTDHARFRVTAADLVVVETSPVEKWHDDMSAVAMPSAGLVDQT